MNNNLTPIFVFFTPYILILLFALLLDLIFFWSYRRRKAFDDTLKYSGIQNTASITKRHVGLLTVDLCYTFEYQGKQYRKVQHVTPDAFNSVKEGDMVRICYQPTDPLTSLLLDLDRRYITYQLTFTCSILICVYSFVLFAFTLLFLTLR